MSTLFLEEDNLSNVDTLSGPKVSRAGKELFKKSPEWSTGERGCHLHHSKPNRQAGNKDSDEQNGHVKVMSGCYSEEGGWGLVKHKNSHHSQVEDDDIPHKPKNGKYRTEQHAKTK